MAKKIERWITKNGVHVPIYAEQSKSDRTATSNSYQSDIKKVSQFYSKNALNNVKVGDEHFSELLSSAVAYVDPKDASTLYIRDRGKLEKYIEEHRRSLHKNATVDSIIAHEMAHAISKKVKEDDILDTAMKEYETSEDYKKALAQDILAKYIPSWQVAAESISRMATSTRHELFAEALADVYANKKNASKISLLIYKIYKENTRKGNT